MNEIDYLRAFVEKLDNILERFAKEYASAIRERNEARDRVSQLERELKYMEERYDDLVNRREF